MFPPHSVGTICGGKRGGLEREGTEYGGGGGEEGGEGGSTARVDIDMSLIASAGHYSESAKNDRPGRKVQTVHAAVPWSAYAAGHARGDAVGKTSHNAATRRPGVLTWHFDIRPTCCSARRRLAFRWFRPAGRLEPLGRVRASASSCVALASPGAKARRKPGESHVWGSLPASRAGPPAGVEPRALRPRCSQGWRPWPGRV